MKSPAARSYWQPKDTSLGGTEDGQQEDGGTILEARLQIGLRCPCSFEACSRTGHMRQDDFLRVVSALKAGQVQTAQEIWDAIQAGSKQMGSRRDGWTGQTSKKPVPVEQSHAQLPTAKVNPPGDNLSEGTTCFLPCPGFVQDPCLYNDPGCPLQLQPRQVVWHS